VDIGSAIKAAKTLRRSLSATESDTKSNKKEPHADVKDCKKTARDNLVNVVEKSGDSVGLANCSINVPVKAGKSNDNKVDAETNVRETRNKNWRGRDEDLLLLLLEEDFLLLWWFDLLLLDDLFKWLFEGRRRMDDEFDMGAEDSRWGFFHSWVRRERNDMVVNNKWSSVEKNRIIWMFFNVLRIEVRQDF
jgi:hypothetical protein